MDKDSFSSWRFRNNDELKYSLRSVEVNAPWINKIFIVTDSQIPKWLNLNNPKIRIVDHSEIIPKKYLPLFNSCAIESRLCYIKDLSEYFLYSNDDCFFWNPVEPEFFFEDGKPIIRLEKPLRKTSKYKHLYGHTIQKAYKTIDKYYKIPIPACFPHHNIDAYRKSFFLECAEEFKDEFEETLRHRFRAFNDLQRMCVAYYTLGCDMAVPKFVKLNWVQKYMFKQIPDSRCYGIRNTILHKILSRKVKLLCLNDCCKTTDEDRIEVQHILQTKFPTKSQFEL